MVSEHTIMFVDDEKSILNAFMRLFRKQGYKILTATNGHEAVDFLKNYNGPVSLIVSDQRMPKMNGSQFLEKAKKIYPDAIRFLMTGYSDMDAIVDSINKGEIHRYFTKPWNDDDFICQVKQAVEQYELIAEKKRLLAVINKQNKKLFDFGKMMDQKVKERSQKLAEKNRALELLNKELEFNILSTVKAFAALSEMNAPLLIKGHGQRVGSLARMIAEKSNLSNEEIDQIEIAGILHDIGKTGLSKKFNNDHNMDSWSVEEKSAYQKHPEQGQKIVTMIKKFYKIGIFIRHHHEQFDGNGYPDNLPGDYIPLGARIIAVADIHDTITMKEKNNNKYTTSYLKNIKITHNHLSEDELVHNAAIFHINKHVFSKYDPEVVKVLLEILKDKGIKNENEKEINIEDLKEDMTISRAIYSNGKLFLPYYTVVSEKIIQRLKNIYKNDKIDDKIFIVEK